MYKYDEIGIIGKGSYGVVVKCRNKKSKEIVAVKKLNSSRENGHFKAMAVREIRILQEIDHENIVKLLEAFKQKRRMYLVFECLDRTVLEELEARPCGLGKQKTREYAFQLLRAIRYCHQRNIIHRDIKPENMLVSKSGILKLCDFGFARHFDGREGVVLTEYVATRWYRAPELLQIPTSYGKAVDIWSIGCVLAELAAGEPIFPGNTDIDQLYRVAKLLRVSGKLPIECEVNVVEMPHSDNIFVNAEEALAQKYPSWSRNFIQIVSFCLRVEAKERKSASELLKSNYFCNDGFAGNFGKILADKIWECSRVKTAARSVYAPILKSNAKTTITAGEEYRKSVGNFRFEPLYMKTPALPKCIFTTTTTTSTRNVETIENTGFISHFPKILKPAKIQD